MFDEQATDRARAVLQNATSARHHRRLQQAAVPAELGAKQEALGKLSQGCRDLVLLAEPGDAYGAYQSLLSAGMVVGNMKKIESSFGLRVSS